MPRRAGKTLTDTTVRRLAPRASRYEVRDAARPGFGVRVETDGRKIFFVRFGAQGARRLTLGVYSASFGLAAARAAADKAMAAVRDGSDPILEKRRHLEAVRSDVNMRKAVREGKAVPGSFAELAERYLRNARRRRRVRSVAEDERKLRVEVLPKWATRRPIEVRRADVLRLIEEVRDSRGGVTSNRTLALVRQVFQFAVDHEELDANPAMRIPRQYLHKERPRERVLSAAEIKTLWEALDAENPVMANAIRMVLLTAQRPGEVLRIRWSDISFDDGGLCWRIPDDVAKTGQGHRVPFSRAASAALDEVRPFTSDSEWVFASPSSRGAGRHLQWLSHAVARIRNAAGVADFTPHDLRRTAATIMGDSGVRPDVIERVLNHVPGKIARTYNRAAYEAEKTQALAILGDRVSAMVARTESLPSNVLRLGRQ